MNDATNTASDDIQAEEEILTCTVSDEALEAAAGTEKGKSPHQPGANSFSGTWAGWPHCC